MTTLGPKPRKGGKIHASPVEDPIRAAFRLLPAAILVLVAGLGPEDREVLAYLVTLPVDLGKEAAAVVPFSEQPARGGGARTGRRRVGCTAPAVWFADHPPTHGCGCFDCYISFWARWDRSPERDLILDALSAFEEHLVAAESSATPPSTSRRRGRRGRLPATTPPPPPPLPMPLRRPKSPVPQDVEVVQALASPLPPPCPPPPLQAPAASTAEQQEKEEEKVVPEPSAASTAEQQEDDEKVDAVPSAAAEPEECGEVAAEVERKRGWADVMGGVLGLRLRLWGIWNPAVESAT